MEKQEEPAVPPYHRINTIISGNRFLEVYIADIYLWEYFQKAIFPEVDFPKYISENIFLEIYFQEYMSEHLFLGIYFLACMILGTGYTH